MKQRQLGKSGVEISSIGLGAMALSSTYRDVDDATAARVINQALDLGMNHIDSADAYGWGHNEELIGRALRERSVFVATKFGQLLDADGRRIVRGDPAYVAEACDASLARLGREVIDLYYAHRVDPQVPIEETVGAMAELVAAGKVRYLGLSEAAPSSIRRGHETHPLTAVQVEYSLWTRFVEDEILGLCDELGIGFVAYSPLGRGFLSGTVKDPEDLEEGDRRRAHPRFQAEHLSQNLKLLEAVQDVAVSRGCSPAQIALAWVLAKRDYVVAIPSTTDTLHLAENAAAADIELTAEEEALLDQVFAPGVVSGDRYPAAAAVHLQK
jgi:aryl-alcohol dehydrogenase-like predicted oxidoreductase